MTLLLEGENEPSREYKLSNPPTALISAVSFNSSESRFLLVSSWDCKVRLYDLQENIEQVNYTHKSPVLDCCFKDSGVVCSGDLEGHLKTFDLKSYSETIIGSHSGAIKCVEYCSDVNVLVTGSWDKSVKLWDSRANDVQGSYPLPDKVFTMSVCGDKIIVGTARRRVLIYDIRSMGYILQRRESSLKYQTRCIRSFPNHQGYVLSSTEGRVAVEYLDPSPEVQRKKFAFKCHRQKNSYGVELIYPVNTIAFHTVCNTFATGGSDGYVNTWDSVGRKRLCQFRRYPTQISALAFSPNGRLLVIASSCIDEFGQNDIPEDSIFVRTLTDQEIKPK